MKKLFSKFSFLLVCLLVFLFFLPPLLKGKVPIPADDLLGLYHPWRDNAYEGYNVGKFPTKNPLITDPVLQTYPWRKLAIESLKDRRLPLWNSYSFSGQPLLANIQSAAFQVTNFFFFILPFNFAWSTQIILPPLLLSLFLYLFLRELRISKISATFGGFAIPLTGFFMVWMPWGTIIATALWLPLMLLCVTKIIKGEKKIFWFLILTFSQFSTIVSGHWQTAFYSFTCFLFYVIYTFLKNRKTQPLITILVSTVAAVLIASPQILPSLEFIGHSARESDQGFYAGRKDWFVPLQNFVQVLAPDYFGNPATYNYWGVWNYAEFVTYIGIFPLTFALIALKNKSSKFFIFLLIFSLFLSFENPISKLLLTHLPFIASMQPSRIIFLMVFSLVALASYGLDEFLKNKKKVIVVAPLIIIFILLVVSAYTFWQGKNFPATSSIDPFRVATKNLILPLSLAFLSFALFLLRKKLAKKYLVLTIFAITCFDLFRFGYKFTSFSKLSWIFPQTKTTQFLEGNAKTFRIMTTDRRIFNGNSSSVYNIESVDGYDPLYLNSYAKLVSAWQSERVSRPGSFNRIITPQKYDSPLANLLGVKYIVTFDEIVSPSFSKVFEEGETKVYENKNALPRVFFANEVVKFANEDGELSALLDRNFDSAKKATSLIFSFSDSPKTSVTIRNYTNGHLSVDVQTDRSAPLVVTIPLYSGWRARLDEKLVPIEKADFMFQSVMVPKGDHVVKFDFHPQSFYSGLYLSALGGLVVFFFSIYLWRLKSR